MIKDSFSSNDCIDLDIISDQNAEIPYNYESLPSYKDNYYENNIKYDDYKSLLLNINSTKFYFDSIKDIYNYCISNTLDTIQDYLPLKLFYRFENDGRFLNICNIIDFKVKNIDVTSDFLHNNKHSILYNYTVKKNRLGNKYINICMTGDNLCIEVKYEGSCIKINIFNDLLYRTIDGLYLPLNNFITYECLSGLALLTVKEKPEYSSDIKMYKISNIISSNMPQIMFIK